MLKDLTLNRDHFADDPFLLVVLDDIARLVHIGMEIRKQGATFRNAKLTNDDVREKVLEVIEGLEEVVTQLVPLLFSMKRSQVKKGALLGEVREQNRVLLELASMRVGYLSDIEKEHYADSPASGNVFRTVQFRLDVMRQDWAVA